MSVSTKFEKILLNQEEFEAVRLTHHPDIYDVKSKDLQAARKRLRDLQSKERTFARENRRISRGKAEARGGSFPGTTERPTHRKQVFAAAVKRLNREIERRAAIEARAPQAKIAEKALAMRRENFVPPAKAVTDKTADEGMTKIASRRRRTAVHRDKVGSISQRTKSTQARRDAKG